MEESKVWYRYGHTLVDSVKYWNLSPHDGPPSFTAHKSLIHAIDLLRYISQCIQEHPGLSSRARTRKQNGFPHFWTGPAPIPSRPGS